MNNTNRMKVPFLDLVSPHEELETELFDVFRKALGTASFIGGRMLEEFEEGFAKLCDSKYCVGVGSGTDALRFALMAAGVQAGNIVLTVPNTFIATTEAITQAGGVPAFVDIDAETYNMDATKVNAYLESECYVEQDGTGTIHRSTGRRVAAIVPVHLYGQMANMDLLRDIAHRYNLDIIEDACQAHGAKYFSTSHGRWYSAGSMGKAAAFSFYPGKNLGACGEAGAITTDDPTLAKKMRMLRDHGQASKYYHDIEGYNGRLDAIQAGILAVKLPHLDVWNERRRRAARRYMEMLEINEAIRLPFEPSWSKAVYHLFVVRIKNRIQVQQALSEANIATGIHYPVPLHLQRAYTYLGYKEGDFPITEQAASEILSLPMYPGLTIGQQEFVVSQLEDAISKEPRQIVAAAASLGN